MADKAVEIDFCEQISHIHERTSLKNELKPHLNQSWCIGTLDSRFCQAIAAKYPNAIKTRMVQDNLNTHDASAFYENLPADEALALAERFDFYYTPKSASWLNVIEIEFSTLSRQCLNRRIPTIEKLEHEILALVAERTEQKIKIDR
ncbi:MAG: hypothetical protein Fur0016_09340 [Anaerolineales bacterium]